MSTGPEHDIFCDHLAQILGSGYTLIGSDIAFMMPYYGYSAKTANVSNANLMKTRSTWQSLARNDVKLTDEKYKGFKIYRDSSLEVAETDIESSKTRIDAIRFRPELPTHLTSEQVEDLAASASESVLHIARCRRCAIQVIELANANLTMPSR